jgi:hypothetical protein
MVARISYSTMQTNSINYMLNFVEEFELVRAKKHPEFVFARDFFKAKKICFQNFYKFYGRFVASGRDVNKLLPIRRGPLPKYISSPLADNTLELKLVELRRQGHNKFTISEVLKKDNSMVGARSASSIYRLFVRFGLERITPKMQATKRKIIREYAGSLLHLDCHYLPRGIVRSHPQKLFYIFGVTDDYSRVSWLEVIESTKAIDATFAMMDAIVALNCRYGIKPEEALTDNGSEFCGGKTTQGTHPFERLLKHFGIKHLRTKAYRPQTNGKIERLWKTFDDEVIVGAIFNTIESLKEAVLGYNIYYNEYRPHQGISGKIPLAMLKG